MRFQKSVKREAREFLTEQLRKYESETEMTKEERQELHQWVSSGRSPYENGDYAYGAGGLLDFITALRMLKDLEEEHYDSEASPFEIQYQYDTQNDEICMEVTSRPDSDLIDEELPFQ